MRRLGVALTLLVLWSAFGYGVNRFLDSRRSNLTAGSHSVVAPTAVTPAFSLPGTIYVSQAGHLYRLSGGRFADLQLPTANGAWTMPAAGPPGQILAVARSDQWSDVFLIDAGSARIVRQITSNRSRSGRVELNAWSFWPHLAADGATLMASYDGPKTGTSYQVDLAVWAGPLTGKLATTRWTTPNGYTGGDVSPVPLPGGGVVYAKYGLTPDEKIVSRLAMVGRPGGTVTYLTAPEDDCTSPAVSPDGSHLAAICTSDTQSARLVVYSLTKGVLGPPAVMVAGCQCASPSWSPDGLSLLYLAPTDAAGHFQLWWIDRATVGAPAAPRLLTARLDLDATSPAAWTTA